MTVEPHQEFVLHATNPLSVGFGRPRPDHAAVLQNGSDIGKVSGNQSLLVKFCSTCPGLKRSRQQTQSPVGLADDPGHVR